jgi:hypothetical protein
MISEPEGGMIRRRMAKPDGDKIWQMRLVF